MITLITGDHIRHKYLVDSFSKNFDDICWIIEKREDVIPSIDRSFNSQIQNLQKIHFEKRYQSEKDFFSEKAGDYSKTKSIKIFEINKEDIENGKLDKILNNIDSNILITYGCHKISNKTLSKFKYLKWNVHGGLSPWYRGVATHFWPSYMLEPEFTGVTLHELSEEIDGGNIIHQTSINLNSNDGVHDNACRVVKNFSDNVPKMIKLNIINEKKIIGINHTSTGRIWTQKMWSPLHLKIIYEVYKDRINEYCLNNKDVKKPKLVTVLN